ncbi:hypothetical protein FHT86_002152 [Rhizobium sp. BK313]|uniref:hypothetical protein n=1 Tax=Rhizobium sp. BK313 TaxID=2587081 RepID=UPI00160F6A8F|nr:hypothetical protein [Rhizobium sp. BK313]MBB3453896.1 hypothetical protein [Rhizobium sp. BK313]
MTTFQTGQNVLQGTPAKGLIPIDNGGAEVAALPVAGGTVTLNGATPVVVANANVTAGSVIAFALKTVGGTVGAIPAIQTITPGTGFTVAGTALDTSIYNYVIIG